MDHKINWKGNKKVFEAIKCENIIHPKLLGFSKSRSERNVYAVNAYVKKLETLSKQPNFTPKGTRRTTN